MVTAQRSGAVHEPVEVLRRSGRCDGHRGREEQAEALQVAQAARKLIGFMEAGTTANELTS